MKINIIMEAGDMSWIYGDFVRAFRAYSKHTILVNSKEKADIYFYVPYYLLPKSKHIKRPCYVWASHQETKSPLKEKFVSAARQANFTISHSKKYMNVLKKNGIKNVKQIIPGVDLDLFKLRNTERPKNNKLVVGFVGRHYQSSSRKNATLLKKISELPFVDFRITGGKMKFKDIPKFYSDLDLTIQPSTVEGGSMAVQQTLAIGSPIILYSGVGVADEFHTGVIKVPFNNSNEFLSRLEAMYETKSYLHYRKPEIMNQMRDQVKDMTYERFVLEHEKIWESLV